MSDQASRAQPARKRGELLNVRQEMTRRRSEAGKLIDAAGRRLATPAAFSILVVFTITWIVLNLVWPGALRDPSPFMLLGSLTSALGPVLSMLILMTQHRNERVAELRDELALQVDLRTDLQMTFLLRALDDATRQRLEERYPEVASLRQPLDPDDLLQRVREHLDRIEGRTTGERPSTDVRRPRGAARNSR